LSVNIETLAFDSNGLIPAIVQDAITRQVLTLAYMNRESLEKTIETKETWFYSRSRKKLWNKGETSGNKQEVKKISYDCDQDALLVQVDPLGPACHKGEESCFHQSLYTNEVPSKEIIPTLVDKIKDRKENPIEGTYTTYLFEQGIDKILKKVGEESSEVIIASKNDDHGELTGEMADLTYHMLVLMEETGVSLADIKKVLIKRHLEKEGKAT